MYTSFFKTTVSFKLIGEDCTGCHFDRRTLETIRGAAFATVDGDYFELENCGFLNPTVAGIATVWKIKTLREGVCWFAPELVVSVGMTWNDQ